MKLNRTFLRILLCAIALSLLALTLSAKGLDGTWNFAFETPLGLRESEAQLTTNGDKVSAKLPESTLEGTYSNGILELSGEVYAREGGYSATLKLKGRLEGEKISGTATWDTYEMPFTVSRGQ